MMTKSWELTNNKESESNYGIRICLIL